MGEPSFRGLPAVHVVAASPVLADWAERRGRAAVVEAVREALVEARQAIARGEAVVADVEGLAADAARRLASPSSHLRRVVNATGILLHTGLGRAPLAPAALEAIQAAASGYSNLELDLETGERGTRSAGVSALLAKACGAEAAAVVNNNAGATVLALRALAAGREVLVSRGELVEIGGSYRLPEIFEVSGARLREVGTTNRTRLADYARVAGPETAAILRVHASNYRIVGFTERPTVDELAGLARERGLALIDDIGSGALGPGLPPGLGDEPTARDGLRAGADVVLFSGDKILGGPQCGIAAGRREVIGRMTADPLMRALRVDKLTLSALEATLRLVLEGGAGIPLWRLMARPEGELRAVADDLAGRLGALGLTVDVVPSVARLGGGSWPGSEIPSWSVRLGAPWPAGVESEGGLAARLRVGRPAVVGRVAEGRVCLDVRAFLDGDDDRVVEALRGVLA